MSVRNELTQDIVTQYTTSYGTYVLLFRAIPALMDGFKPVQRRFVVSARDMELWNRKSTIKVAKVCGEVMGNYHPHGEAYGTLVGMTQDFNSRYPLFHGQGNWGSADAPSAAAMRYTECKLTKFAEDFYLSEAEYGDYEDNYDGRLRELTLMYPKLPGCLLTGNSGIAVGITTSIPFHSITDVGKSLLKYMDDPTSEDFLSLISPETCQPTKILTTKADIQDMYRRGYGSVKYGSVFHYEQVDKKRKALVVESFPPEFSRRKLESPDILEAVDKGRLELINESTEKIRYVFISQDDALLKKIEEKLYSTVSYKFHIQHLGVIKMYPLKDIYNDFLIERRKFVVRKYNDMVAKADVELSYLNALLKLKADKQYVKDMFDKDYDVVKSEIMVKYGITDKTAGRILASSLRSLMNDNQPQLLAQIKELTDKTTSYKSFVADPDSLIRKEINDLVNEYKGDTKRATF